MPLLKSESEWLACTVLATLLLCIVTSASATLAASEEELDAKLFLENYRTQMLLRMNRCVIGTWNYETNITDHNEMIKEQTCSALLEYNIAQEKLIDNFSWRTFHDKDIKRQFQLLKNEVPSKEERWFNDVPRRRASMVGIYSTAKICDFHNRTKCDIAIESLVRTEDVDELVWRWKEMRRVRGGNLRPLFSQYVSELNEAATQRNFSHGWEIQMLPYEDLNFLEEVQRLERQLRPLRLQLHAYVRRQLRLRFGEGVVSRDGPIPIHVLSADRDSPLRPFPDVPSTDVTSNMIEQGYTPQLMFRLAEKFYTSLNMTNMPALFWERSILEKPADREIVCHPNAWDFFDGEDYRIKACTEVTMQDLYMAYHEMGHIQYFINYKDQPLSYMAPANPGFTEAIGDVIALSAMSPKHLQETGLLTKRNDDQRFKETINRLYTKSIISVLTLTHQYIMDLWRSHVFSGRVLPEDYNCHYWKLSEEIEGFEPPVDRSEDDFDPAVLYHVVAGMSTTSYFVAAILELQIHRALCQEAGQFDPNDPRKPLHDCNIYGSTAAGEKLKALLRMGMSRPWPEALQVVTGSRTLDASDLLIYFRPLADWLEEENRRTGERIGWLPSKRVCRRTQADQAAAFTSSSR